MSFKSHQVIGVAIYSLALHLLTCGTLYGNEITLQGHWDLTASATKTFYEAFAKGVGPFSLEDDYDSGTYDIEAHRQLPEPPPGYYLVSELPESVRVDIRATAAFNLLPAMCTGGQSLCFVSGVARIGPLSGWTYLTFCPNDIHEVVDIVRTVHIGDGQIQTGMVFLAAMTTAGDVAPDAEAIAQVSLILLDSIIYDQDFSLMYESLSNCPAPTLRLAQVVDCPEPPSLALFATAVTLMCLLGFARSKRKKQAVVG